MPNIILSDAGYWKNLLPFTFTRPVAELRCGMRTLTQKWEKYLGTSINGFATEDYLQEKYPVNFSEENLLINATALPTLELAQAVQSLKQGQALTAGEEVIAIVLPAHEAKNFTFGEKPAANVINFSGKIDHIHFPWNLFSLNGSELKKDYKQATAGRLSEPVPENVVTYGNQIFIEEGAKIYNCTLNSETGPIYIGKDAEIMEGCIVRGPFSMDEHSVLKLGAKIYGPTTLGPWCKVGGEVNNALFYAYSNKGHDGFIGNAVIGEWCNIGADTNCSNLKNNYAEVKVWSYVKGGFAGTGLQFCGLMMGDHSKCGINTMFNTGTVVGVSANIFGAGFPRTFIPSYTWGGAQGFTTYQFSKAMETTELVLQRRNLHLSEVDHKILQHVFDLTAQYRK